MEFKAYRRSDGAWLLVPDCLVASREAQARHGPLVLAARFDVECRGEDAVWHRVLDDIDAQAYAVVRRETGECLVRRAKRDKTPGPRGSVNQSRIQSPVWE